MRATVPAKMFLANALRLYDIDFCRALVWIGLVWSSIKGRRPRALAYQFLPVVFYLPGVCCIAYLLCLYFYFCMSLFSGVGVVRKAF